MTSFPSIPPLNGLNQPKPKSEVKKQALNSSPSPQDQMKLVSEELKKRQHHQQPLPIKKVSLVESKLSTSLEEEPKITIIKDEKTIRMAPEPKRKHSLSLIDLISPRKTDDSKKKLESPRPDVKLESVQNKVIEELMGLQQPKYNNRLSMIMSNSALSKVFSEYLKDQHTENNYAFLVAVKRRKEIQDPVERITQAIWIYKKFLKKESKGFVNLEDGIEEKEALEVIEFKITSSIGLDEIELFKKCESSIKTLINDNFLKTYSFQGSDEFQVLEKDQFSKQHKKFDNPGGKNK